MCHICEKDLLDDKVRDHCHITGKYIGPAHNACDLNRIESRIKIPVFFHNGKCYNSHFIINEISNIAEIKDNDMDMLKSNFSNIADMKIKNGFKFLVCIHPDLTERENSNDIKIVPVIKLFKFPYFHMKEYYKKTGIPFDLLKVRSNDICHPNELGHLLISKAFFTEFKRNNFIR